MLPGSFHQCCEAFRIQIPHPAQMTRQMPIYNEVAKHRLVKGRIPEIGLVAETQEEIY